MFRPGGMLDFGISAVVVLWGKSVGLYLFRPSQRVNECEIVGDRIGGLSFLGLQRR